MKKFILFSFMLLTFIAVGCDGANPFGESQNPPKVSLIIINEDELNEKNLGDSIDIELGLEANYMPDLMSLNFEVIFDPEYFSPKDVCSGLGVSGQDIVYPYETEGECMQHGNCYNDLGYKLSTDVLEASCSNEWKPFSWGPFNFRLTDSFFKKTIDNYEDSNDNGQWDCYEWSDDQSQCLDGEFINDDNNGDGLFDPPVMYPTGMIMVLDGSFTGNLGIVPDPENDLENIQYAGYDNPKRICNFYLTGVLQETFLDINIISAEEYIDDETDPDLIGQINLWNVNPLPVYSPYSPVVYLEIIETSDDPPIVKVAVKVEDSPRLAQFKTQLEYDDQVLFFGALDDDEFFNTNYSRLNGPIDVDLEGKSGVKLHFYVNDDNVSSEDDEYLVSGDGTIAVIDFGVLDDSNPSTITINTFAGNTDVKGFNATSSESYSFDLNYWDIMTSFVIDLPNLLGE